MPISPLQATLKTVALTNPVVRDLFWCCHAPELMCHDFKPQFNVPSLAWFSELDNAPQALLTHLSSKNLYLIGSYFEALWEFLLSNAPDTELVAKNIQVFTGQGRDRRTLGEMDFIYFCKRRRCHVHLEVALKFYLGYFPSGSTQDKFCAADHWLGPKCNDRLDIKFSKLCDKQSLLSDTVEGRAVLDKLDVTIAAREIAMPGYLFKPLNADADFYPADLTACPIYSNPDHLSGYWLSLSNFLAAFSATSLWHVLLKPRWMSAAYAGDIGCFSATDIFNRQLSLTDRPISAFDHSGLMTHAQCFSALELHFHTSDNVIMLDRYDAHTSHACERICIVPDNWPFVTKLSQHLFR